MATGLATWFGGSPGSAWVFGAHAVGGTALAIVLVWKLRRIWTRVADRSRWEARTRGSLTALVLVAATFEVDDRLLTDVGGTLGVAGAFHAGHDRDDGAHGGDARPPAPARGQATAGFEVCGKHVRGAPRGARCTACATLRKVVDGRKQFFDVEVVEAIR